MAGLLAGAAGGATVAIVIQAIDKFSGVFALADKKLLALGGAITAVGIAGAFAVGGLVKMAGQFEQTQISFTTMLGSAELANKLLKDLADFASKTPFTITGIEDSAKQLLAMGVGVDDMIPTLKFLGDISAGLNVPLSRLALNFGQVRIQGKLTGRELRDFAIAGVPLVAELAKNLGVSEEKIAQMVSRGEIGFDLVEEAFKSMTDEGGKFFDLMDAQSKTFLGQVSNIEDSFIILGREMGEVFLPIAKTVAEALSKIIGWMAEHPKIAKFAAITLGLATAMALIVGPMFIMVALLPLMAAGAAALSIGLLPLTLIVIGIGAAILGIIAIGLLLFKHWDTLKLAAGDMGTAVENVFIGIANIVSKIWNFLVQLSEDKLNSIIGLLNQATKLVGITIPEVSLDRLKTGTIDFKKLTPKRTEISSSGRAALEAKGVTFVNNGTIVADDSPSFARIINNALRSEFVNQGL